QGFPQDQAAQSGDALDIHDLRSPQLRLGLGLQLAEQSGRLLRETKLDQVFDDNGRVDDKIVPAHREARSCRINAAADRPARRGCGRALSISSSNSETPARS